LLTADREIPAAADRAALVFIARWGGRTVIVAAIYRIMRRWKKKRRRFAWRWRRMIMARSSDRAGCGYVAVSAAVGMLPRLPAAAEKATNCSRQRKGGGGRYLRVWRDQRALFSPVSAEFLPRA